MILFSNESKQGGYQQARDPLSTSFLSAEALFHKFVEKVGMTFLFPNRNITV
jgi:hypothetical protein